MSKFHLDLFSGIGGFAIAAQACGYKTIGFCERELYAQQILKERFGAVLADAESLHGNGSADHAGSIGNLPGGQGATIRQLGSASLHPSLHDNIFTLNGADYAGVDLLTGGFPCQPFSVAGKRLGKADDRAIWPEMLRVIREAKPTWIIGENVAGIVTMELDNILSDLESLGYSAWPIVIPACAVDARHRRDRVWIVAHAIGMRESQSSGSFADERGRTGNEGEDVAHAGSAGLEGLSGDGNDGNQSRRHDKKQSGPACTRRLLPGGWREVVFAAECDPEGDGLCPCGFEYSDECSHPGPTQDGYEYIERDGVLYGRPEGQLEPAICGMADGIPEGMDGGARFCQWPEEDYSTPRVTTGIKHRAHRLKGLGNSIVPQVAKEIIQAITNLI
jgi:DNA (cytosine-5)-methyltransferase 1